MHPHFADGVLQLQVGVGLTVDSDGRHWQAATPRLRLLSCGGTLYSYALTLWLVFSQHWTKIRQICSPRWSCACTNTLRTTGY